VECGKTLTESVGGEVGIRQGNGERGRTKRRKRRKRELRVGTSGFLLSPLEFTYVCSECLTKIVQTSLSLASVLKASPPSLNFSSDSFRAAFNTTLHSTPRTHINLDMLI
jgi:hypothetical protein